MQIECLLKRAGGTIVDLPPKQYHFLPLADGAHVAEVDNDQHIAKLLAIPEAYRLYRMAAAVASTLTSQPGTAVIDADIFATGTSPAQYTTKIDNDGHIDGFSLNATPTAHITAALEANGAVAPALVNLGFPESFTINGEVYEYAKVLDKARAGNGFNQPDWDALSDDTKIDLIEEELEKLEDGGKSSAADAVAAAAAADSTIGAGAVDERAALVEQYVAKFGKKPHHNAGVDKIRAELAA